MHHQSHYCMKRSRHTSESVILQLVSLIATIHIVLFVVIIIILLEGSLIVTK